VRRLSRRAAITSIGAAAAAGFGCKRREKVRLEDKAERGPAVIESTVHTADPQSASQLLKGFHEIEQNSWRWTAGQFAVSLRPPKGSAESGATLVMKFTIPDAVVARVKTTTLTAAISGKTVGSSTYSTAGEYTFTADVPAGTLGSEPVTVEFSLSGFLPAGTVDARELGVVVSSISFEPK
jgi:hypothetical protein